MKQLLFLLITSFLLCISCNEENIDMKSESGLVQVSIFYATKDNPNTLIPDSDSKIFIYYDKHSIDFAGYSFQDGKLTKGEKIILPDQKASTNEHGEISLYLNYIDKPLSILVESNYYKRVSAETFSSGEDKIAITINNYP